MDLNGKNGEYAEYILKKLYEHEGWISSDELLMAIHDKYDYAVGPEIVLHGLVDDSKLIIKDGEIYRLTREGDKAARKGVRRYEKKKSFMEKTITMKLFLKVVATLITIIVTLISFFISILSSKG